QILKGLTPLRVHLQTMDNRTRTIHRRSNPSNAGNKTTRLRRDYRNGPR
ncbi:integrase, partial [Amaricoccus sp. HAR-UPW-R2A-40]